MAPKTSDKGKASASTAGAAESESGWTKELNGLLMYAAEREIPFKELTQAKDKNDKHIFGASRGGYGHSTLRTYAGEMKRNPDDYDKKVPTENDVKLHYPEIYALQPKEGEAKMNKGRNIWTDDENVRFVKLMYRDGYKLKDIIDKKLLADRSQDSIISHWKRGLRPDYLFRSEPPKFLGKQLDELRGLAVKFRDEKEKTDFNYVHNYRKEDANTDQSGKASSSAAGPSRSRPDVSPGAQSHHKQQQRKSGGLSKRDAGSSDENKPSHKKRFKIPASQAQMPDIASMELSDEQQKEKERVEKEALAKRFRSWT